MEVLQRYTSLHGNIGEVGAEIVNVWVERKP
jgi:hypothetical protein